MYTEFNTGVNQVGIHDGKEDNDNDYVMDDIDDSESGSCADKESVDKGLDDE